MGVYYVWVCDELKEQVDPDDLGESCKNPFGPKTLSLLEELLTGRWHGRPIRLLSDEGGSADEWYDISDKYKRRT
jgi:hypothetical protein